MRSCAAALLLVLCGATGLASQEAVVARRVIYPRQTILPDMVETIARRPSVSDSEGLLAGPADVIGRIAATTILPGQTILRREVTDPPVLTNGAAVRLRFVSSDVEIVASGVALQAGQIGARIRVRNAETGIVVDGVIAADGSVVAGGP